MPTRLTHEVAAARLADLGFELCEPYQNNSAKTLVRCVAHSQTHAVALANVMSGRIRLICCKRASLRAANTGKRQTQAAKDKISAHFCDLWKKVPHPSLGLIRSAETLERLRLSHLGHVNSLDAVIGTARTGRTGNKRGHFYVARHPDGWLKFGSTTTGMRQRLYSLKCRDKVDYEVLLVAEVPDAGAYEAMMMDHHRQHWIQGERFRDFLVPS